MTTANETAELLNDLLAGTGWEHDADIYGICFTLTCPCGEKIEQDGECTECGPSPVADLI